MFNNSRGPTYERSFKLMAPTSSSMLWMAVSITVSITPLTVDAALVASMVTVTDIRCVFRVRAAVARFGQTSYD